MRIKFLVFGGGGELPFFFNGRGDFRFHTAKLSSDLFFLVWRNVRWEHTPCSGTEEHPKEKVFECDISRTSGRQIKFFVQKSLT